MNHPRDSVTIDDGHDSPCFAVRSKKQASVMRVPREDELARAQRIASDRCRRDDLEWLRQGFNLFLVNEGRLPLERCLHLPNNERALRRALRDHWLRRAWQSLDVPSSWCRSEMLAAEIQRFRDDEWQRWLDLEQAPAEATPFKRALFNAFRSHDRVPSTAMHLHNIAGMGSG